MANMVVDVTKTFVSNRQLVVNEDNTIQKKVVYCMLLMKMKRSCKCKLYVLVLEEDHCIQYNLG